MVIISEERLTKLKEILNQTGLAGIIFFENDGKYKLFWKKSVIKIEDGALQSQKKYYHTPPSQPVEPVKEEPTKPVQKQTPVHIPQPTAQHNSLLDDQILSLGENMDFLNDSPDIQQSHDANVEALCNIEDVNYKEEYVTEEELMRYLSK